MGIIRHSAIRSVPGARHVRSSMQRPCRLAKLPPSALFLNTQGNAVSVTRLTAVFADAFRAAGVTGTPALSEAHIYDDDAGSIAAAGSDHAGPQFAEIVQVALSQPIANSLV
ncbi:hypothetical protein MesoLj131a_61460 [Mesorhizobium sp. 131-2-1]|nr:hypothetical protein MesoLj131a_61460 [Mesorhizobium sp. 131-2-1]BCH04353.1 hypothetical protein MesoLj131b_63520 [Mesorhizobium sp. 131-2-5]